MARWWPIWVTLRTGMFPTDAWLTVEITAEGVEIIETVDWSPLQDVDFAPAFAWAESCTLEGCPPAPDGWAIKGWEPAKAAAASTVRAEPCALLRSSGKG